MVVTRMQKYGLSQQQRDRTVTGALKNTVCTTKGLMSKDSEERPSKQDLTRWKDTIANVHVKRRERFQVVASNEHIISCV